MRDMNVHVCVHLYCTVHHNIGALNVNWYGKHYIDTWLNKDTRHSVTPF